MLFCWHQTEHGGLPAPLPLQDQIESSEEILSDTLPDPMFEESHLVANDCDGTFDSEAQLNSLLLDMYVLSMPSMEGKAEFYRRAWPSFFSEHEPTFSHGDLQKQNIVLSEEGGRKA